MKQLRVGWVVMLRVVISCFDLLLPLAVSLLPWSLLFFLPVEMSDAVLRPEFLAFSLSPKPFCPISALEPRREFGQWIRSTSLRAMTRKVADILIAPLLTIGALIIRIGLWGTL